MKQLLLSIALLGALSTYGSDVSKVPAFRKAAAVPEKLPNPFAGNSSVRLLSTAADDQMLILHQLIGEHFNEQMITGCAFRPEGTSLGVIIAGHVYEEGECYMLPGDSGFQVQITAITRDALHLSCKISGAMHTIKISLPCLSK